MGREAKIDIKSLAFNDKRKKLAFSTFTPGKVIKLEKFNVKRIKVVDGKFYAYFIDCTVEGEQVKDSEFDAEEEKDIVGGFEEGSPPAGDKPLPNQAPVASKRHSNAGSSHELNKNNTSGSDSN